MKTVRIFSLLPAGGYEYRDYPASVWAQEGIATENGGACRSCSASIRIMTRKDIFVKPGDFASLEAERTAPDKNNDYMITAVRDNRRGILPHWRLMVNGGI